MINDLVCLLKDLGLYLPRIRAVFIHSRLCFTDENVDLWFANCHVLFMILASFGTPTNITECLSPESFLTGCCILAPPWVYWSFNCG